MIGPTQPGERRRAFTLLSVCALGLATLGFGAFEARDSGPQPVAAAAPPATREIRLRFPSLAYDGTPEPTPVPTPAPPPPPPAPTIEGQRVWSHGDSTSYYMTVAIYAQASAAGGSPVEAADYKISSGLLNPAFFDWPSFIGQEMAAYNPDLAVFMIGANDAMQIRSYEDYAARVGAVMDLMYRPGRVLVWMGQPNMQPNPALGYNPALVDRIPAINEVFRDEAAKRSWVVYVDTWALTSWSDGTYAPVLPDENGVEQALRAPDGIHFTPAGGRRLALAALAAALAR